MPVVLPSHACAPTAISTAQQAIRTHKAEIDGECARLLGRHWAWGAPVCDACLLLCAASALLVVDLWLLDLYGAAQHNEEAAATQGNSASTPCSAALSHAAWLSLTAAPRPTEHSEHSLACAALGAHWWGNTSVRSQGAHPARPGHVAGEHFARPAPRPRPRELSARVPRWPNGRAWCGWSGRARCGWSGRVAPRSGLLAYYSVSSSAWHTVEPGANQWYRQPLASSPICSSLK